MDSQRADLIREHWQQYRGAALKAFAHSEIFRTPIRSTDSWSHPTTNVVPGSVTALEFCIKRGNFFSKVYQVKCEGMLIGDRLNVIKRAAIYAPLPVLSPRLLCLR